MKHVVKEANAGINGNLLRLAGLGGVAVTAIEEAGIGVWGKVAAVEVDGKLDLGLVGVTGESGPARRVRSGHCKKKRGDGFEENAIEWKIQRGRDKKSKERTVQSTPSR